MELTTAARRRHRKTTPGQDALVWPRGSGSLGVGKARYNVTRDSASWSTDGGRNCKAKVTPRRRRILLHKTSVHYLASLLNNGNTAKKDLFPWSKKDAGASTNEKAVVTEHNRALMSNCPSSTKVQGPGNANFPSTCKKCGV
ncbi:hypothetical protein SEVIR_3G366550v4 [Setaria viridis]